MVRASTPDQGPGTITGLTYAIAITSLATLAIRGFGIGLVANLARAYARQDFESEIASSASPSGSARG